MEGVCDDMSERLQIIFMQARLVRLAADKWNTSISKVNSIFAQKNVYHYINNYWGIFHVEGDNAVLEDIERYIGRRDQDDQLTN